MTLQTHDIKDITIIGGGPAGLFASFYAGMRKATAQIVDALPQLGGQLTALYPEKYIFDVAGFPKVLAKDLVRQLTEQAAQFDHPSFLNQRVTGLEEENGHFVLTTDHGRFPTRSLIIAAGIGAFSPRRLPQPCAEGWYGRGIYDVVTNPDDYAGHNVMIIGGGDSAFDWAAQLMDRAAHVTLVHRSDKFRAHGATVEQVKAGETTGKATLHTFHELAEIDDAGGRIGRVTLKDIKAKSTRTVDVDVILPMLGFLSDMGQIAEWGLTMGPKQKIVVDTVMNAGRPGVYAAGDVTTYAGKLDLIATGFGEAAVAVNQAVHWIYPDRKINPGHSSNLEVFGQKDD